ncbi:protein kinase family protein [Nonomuraea antri]|uniref:trifolitoxin immunity protein n=1 Tax=Nonomuraea antri TaxID=2730852 RepID=UPI001567FF5F|nr:trifolitoxin immunity protein [Nonomuraea antri]
MAEIPLAGGFVNQVVRVGDTVRRAGGARAAFVRELLAGFERAGWAGAPRHLGTDERGREVLSFVAGEVPWEPARAAALRSDANLVRVAELVREFHDLTVGMARAFGAEVVCHNDLSPRNTVYRDPGDPHLADRNLGDQDPADRDPFGRNFGGRDPADWNPADWHLASPDLADQYLGGRDPASLDLGGRGLGLGARPVAFIDWDLAAPGRRVHDLAHVCWQFLDLGPGVRDVRQAARRLRLICDAYGTDARLELVEAILWWQDRCWRGIESGAAAGEPAMVRLRDVGAPAAVLAAHRWVTEHRAQLEAPLRHP